MYARHAARMGELRKSCIVLISDFKVRVYLGIVRVSWKIVLKSLVNKHVVELELSRPNQANRYNPEAGCCEKGNELSDFIKGG
jgi:hypothetical protein